MSDSEKKDKPVSNPTSPLARELMLKTLAKLAVEDKDEELAEQVSRARQQQKNK